MQGQAAFRGRGMGAPLRGMQARGGAMRGRGTGGSPSRLSRDSSQLSTSVYIGDSYYSRFRIILEDKADHFSSTRRTPRSSSDWPHPYWPQSRPIQRQRPRRPFFLCEFRAGLRRRGFQRIFSGIQGWFVISHQTILIAQQTEREEL